MIATIKVFKSWERQNHAVIMSTLKPLIDNRGLEITSYSVNPIDGDLEIEIDNPKTNRRVIIEFVGPKDVRVWEYLNDKDQKEPNFMYPAKVKNFSSSKRIIETISHLFKN